MTSLQIVALCLNVVGAALLSYGVYWGAMHIAGQYFTCLILKEFHLRPQAAGLLFVVGSIFLSAGVTLLSV